MLEISEITSSTEQLKTSRAEKRLICSGLVCLPLLWLDIFFRGTFMFSFTTTAELLQNVLTDSLLDMYGPWNY